MKERDAKMIRLTELFPDKWDEIEKLHRLLTAYDKLQEQLCNGQGWWHGYDVRKYYGDDESLDTPLGRAEARHEAKIVELVKQIDPELRVEFQGDPRGYCVKINRELRHSYTDKPYMDCLSWLFYY